LQLRIQGNAELAGVDNAGVVKSALWVISTRKFNTSLVWTWPMYPSPKD